MVMGTVIDFPVAQRLSRAAEPADHEGRGAVVILPVIRVERFPDNPSDGIESGTRGTAGRKRRRRASRS
jgi:hypothetical protein